MRKKILFVTSEVSPFAQTGGLAETSFSLPLALFAYHDVDLIMPLYSIIDVEVYNIVETDMRFTIPVSDKEHPVKIWKGTLPDTEIPIYFVSSHYFERDSLYGNVTGDYPDNSERFVFFSRATLEFAAKYNKPDIIHCNDWQSSLVPLYLKEYYQKHKRELFDTKTLLTIHNLGYQGKFWVYDLHILNLGWEIFSPEKIEFYNQINFLKGGIVYADAVTTISRRYAEEIQSPEFGLGLEGVLQKYHQKLFGISNGVDGKKWSPALDPFIEQNYSASDLSGKHACKKALMKQLFNVEATDKPVYGIISRIVNHKGIDILMPALDRAAQELSAKFVILGVGDKMLETQLRSLSSKYPEKVKAVFKFDEKLAHQIEAGADFIIMPSRYEPCGMNQMYSMKYGTIPIVRSVGGLADTVIDISEGEHIATGLSFNRYSSDQLYEKIKESDRLYFQNPDLIEKIRINGMQQNFSWEKAAQEYSRLYEKI